MSQQEYFIKFSRELGELNGNIKSVLSRLEKGDEKMAQHEARLSALERGGRGVVGALPRWAVYVIVGLLAALLGALGVKVPGVM